MALRRAIRRTLAAAAVGLALAALADAARLWQSQRIAAAIADPAADLSGDGPPPLVFARALRAGARGDMRSALSDYRLVIDAGDERLAADALYNAGNLHLREALRLRGQQEKEKDFALPLLEMAKQNYREALRREPQHWDARYNLERALRLAPETEEADPEHLPPPPPRERAITTMKGFTLGLP